MQLSYRWVIIAAGALMTCVAAGAMFSLAVFLQPMSLATGWSRAGIAGFVWGSLSDRYGVRIVVLCGAVLMGLALVLASQAASLTQFQLIYGILVGFSAGAFFAPLIAAATGWFETNRSLAVSLVSAGLGVAPMTVSPVVGGWIFDTFDAYSWLFIGSAAVGLGAVAVALAFPPLPSSQRPAWQPA